MNTKLQLLLMILLTASSALSQDSTPTAEPEPQTESQAAQPQPCSADAYSDFDFWLGEWTVHSKNLQGEKVLAGHNTISKILDGCVIREQWRGNGATIGQSFNTFDRSRGVWHQTWVDNQGLLLKLDGGLVDGAMVLSGLGPGFNRNNPGQRVLHEIRWQTDKTGNVTQTWRIKPLVEAMETSEWQTVFVGEYQQTEE